MRSKMISGEGGTISRSLRYVGWDRPCLLPRLLPIAIIFLTATHGNESNSLINLVGRVGVEPTAR